MILTTLIYLENTLNTFGMQCAHLSRPTALSDIVYCAMERPLPLAMSGAASRDVNTLMSFLGCIGTLMKASGVNVLLTAAFGRVAGIITCKSWTNALRAYRFITTYFSQSGANMYQELSDYTWWLWVECLFNPTLLALQLLPIPAGQPRGDEPHFFAAGHVNYACYMTWYLRNVKNLPTAAKNDPMKGAHVCCHSGGGTAVPVDQFGDQTDTVHQAMEG